MDAFVARQPIFDRSGQLCAYELLFRSNAVHNAFDGSCSTSASAQVIANSLFSIGIQNILCDKKAFVNFDRTLLLSGLHSLLPPEVLVVEILESVEPDDDILAVCRSLRRQGYTIALDDFVSSPQLDPLCSLARIIKVDLMATPRSEQERLLRIYQPLGMTMLAEKVETHDDFEWARNAGYELFQGYFFARPRIVKGQRIPAAKVACLRLLSEVQKGDLDFKRLRTLISQDVSLSHNLLLFANSALFAHVEVRSIDHALALLGEEHIRRWAVLATLPVLATNTPGELITLSLVRARFCEHIARLSGIAHAGQGFMMGLFSLLDGLTGLSLEESLARVHVAPVIRGALTGTSPVDDVYRTIYKLVRHYESGDWDMVRMLAAKLNIEGPHLAGFYAESTSWAGHALHPTPGCAPARGARTANAA